LPSIPGIPYKYAGIIYESSDEFVESIPFMFWYVEVPAFHGSGKEERWTRYFQF
jgi:hypothetical protein